MRNVFYLCSLIAVFIAGLNAQETALTKELCPPYPVAFEQKEIVGMRPFLKYGVETIMYLEFDSTGTVSKISSQLPRYQGYAAYLRQYFKQYKFNCESDGTYPVLPVEISLPFDSSDFTVRWPLGGKNEEGQFIQTPVNKKACDNILYTIFLEINNRNLPEIKIFPSYYAPLYDTDTLFVSPQLSYRLLVSDDGTVKRISPAADGNSFKQYEHQLASAIRFAEFQPALIDSSAIETEALLSVAFYPSIAYPTVPYKAGETDSYDIYFRNSLKVLPWYSGLIRRPLLRHETSFSQAALEYLPDTIAIRVGIDSMGYTTLMHMPDIDSTYQKLFRRNINKLRFWPALLADGRGTYFEGMLHLQPSDSTSIRITPAWLMY